MATYIVTIDDGEDATEDAALALTALIAAHGSRSIHIGTEVTTHPVDSAGPNMRFEGHTYRWQQFLLMGMLGRVLHGQGSICHVMDPSHYGEAGMNYFYYATFEHDKGTMRGDVAMIQHIVPEHLWNQVFGDEPKHQVNITGTSVEVVDGLADTP